MKQRPNGIVFRAVSAAMILLYLNSFTFSAWAGGSASASNAQELGRQLLNSFNWQNSQKTLKDIYPDTGNVNTLEGVYGNDGQTIQIGNEAHGRLATEQSMDGDAYRLLKQTGKRTSVDLTNDPMFNTADAIRNDNYMNSFKEEFADCGRTNLFEQTEVKKHVPDVKYCERLYKPKGSCEILHEIKIKAAPVDLVFLVDNSGSMGAVISSLRISVSNLAKLLGETNEGDLRIGGAVQTMPLTMFN